MLPGLSDPFWVGLLAKMLATAAIVVAVSALVERVGPFLGAMIATLPISAGPALVFVAMDHGPALLDLTGYFWAGLIERISSNQRSPRCPEVEKPARNRLSSACAR